MAKRISLIIVLVGFLLRLPLLNGSFWLDEAAQALESSRPLAQQLAIIPDFQPPLLHLILHFAIYFGQSEWWLRLIGALIPGLITIYFTYLIGTKIISQKAGVWAGLLLATSSFHIFYSQELRPYSLSAMWAAISWWALINWADKKYFFTIFTLSSILGLYTSYLYPFLLLSQVLYIFYALGKKLKSFAISLAIIGLSFIPWLPNFIKQLAEGGMVRKTLPGWEMVVSTPQLKTIPLVLAKFLFGVVDLSLSWYFLIITFVVGLLGLFLFVKTPQNQIKKWLALIIWFVFPFLTSWLVSFWIPVVQPKRLIILLPAWYLILAAMGTGKTKLAKVFLALVLGLNIIGSWQYYQNSNLQRENWRQAHIDITAKYPGSESIAVFVYIAPYSPWVWYDNWEYPTLYTHTLHVDQNEDLRAWLEPATTRRYIVVFDYLRDLTDPSDKLIQEIEAYNYQLIDLLEYPNLGFVRIFAKQESVLSLGDR